MVVGRGFYVLKGNEGWNLWLDFPQLTRYNKTDNQFLKKNIKFVVLGWQKLHLVG